MFFVEKIELSKFFQFIFIRLYHIVLVAFAIDEMFNF